MNLPPMLPGKSHVGQYVTFCLLQNIHGFREFPTKLLGDLSELNDSRFLARLRKNRPEDRRYHRLRRLRHLAQNIAHEVNTATLPSGTPQNLLDRSAQPFVSITNR